MLCTSGLLFAGDWPRRVLIRFRPPPLRAGLVASLPFVYHAARDVFPHTRSTAWYCTSAARITFRPKRAVRAGPRAAPRQPSSHASATFWLGVPSGRSPRPRGNTRGPSSCIPTVQASTHLFSK